MLDVDICGPSMPKIFGVEGEQVHHSSNGWSPVVRYWVLIGRRFVSDVQSHFPV